MQNSYWRAAQLALLGVILLGWGLLSWHLGDQNLWIDEFNTFHMIQGSPQQVINNAANDFHPPLYFLILHFWTELAGTSDFSLRWPSIAASLLCLPLLAVLARRLAGSPATLWSVLLLSLAPAAVEFGRMARYYSLAMLLGLLSTILLLIALKRGTWLNWIAYALSALGLLYTFYPNGILLAGQALIFIWPQRRQAAARRWLATMTIVGLAFAPWFLSVAAGQSARMSSGINADLSHSISGLVLGVVSATYTFSVGESLFPWFPVAWIGLLIVAGLVMISFRRSRRAALQLVVLGLVCIVFISLVTAYVAVGTPFLEVSARGLLALPYFMLLLALGLSAIKYVKRTWLVVGALALVWAVSLFNLFTRQQYLNPIYITPATEAADYVRAHADPADLVISDGDSVFPRYFSTGVNSPRQLDTQQIDQIQATLNEQPIKRVWLITLGRDRTRNDVAEHLSEFLQQDRRLCTTIGFAEQDPIYRQLKTSLIGREAYAYRLTVQEFCP